MKTIYVTLEEILRLHFQVIEDFGGSHGVRDENRLISVVDEPKQIVFGVEQYPSIYEKASVYLRNIIGDHPFSDGNKRTALTVTAIFLMRNHLEFRSSQKDLELFVISIAIKKLTVPDIAKWLRKNTRLKE